MQTVSLMVGPLVAILDEFYIWTETKKGRSQPIYFAPSFCRITYATPSLFLSFYLLLEQNDAKVQTNKRGGGVKKSLSVLPAPPIRYRLLQLQIKHGWSDKRSRA